MNKRRVENISAHILKKIRKDLGVKQRELECDGIKNVSRIENGTYELTGYSAIRLCTKINEIIKEKNLFLDYEVTVDLLMGKTNILTDELLKRLNTKEEPISLILNDINEEICKLRNDEAIELLKNTIDILVKDIYINSVQVKEYCYKLLKLNLNKRDVIETYNNLMRAHYVLEEFKEMIAVSKAIEIDINESGNTKLINSFYGNLVRAYNSLNMPECSDIALRKMNKSDLETELFILNIKGITKSITKDFDAAEKLFKTLIEKSTKKNHEGYIISAYTNLSDIYILKEEYKNAEEVINIASSLINSTNHIQFIFNLKFNKFLLDFKMKSENEFNKSYNEILIMAKNMNNTKKQNEILIKMIEFYKDYPNVIYNNMIDAKYKYKVIINSDTIINAALTIAQTDLVVKILEISR